MSTFTLGQHSMESETNTDGYATCSFPVRRYDSGAIFYPYLHWFPNECYYE